MFVHERMHPSSQEHPVFNLCCRFGKVKLPPVQPPPVVLRNLFEDIDSDGDSTFFRHNIRAINSSLAFASIEAEVADLPGKRVPVFRMNGESYH